jgi:hypothetical protein
MSALSAAANGALVQNFMRKLARSKRSNSGRSMMRWYCTGTSIACVARCRCASSRNFSASNFPISTTVPPIASVGKKLTSVVFEYSGVEQIVTAVRS